MHTRLPLGKMQLGPSKLVYRSVQAAAESERRRMDSLTTKILSAFMKAVRITRIVFSCSFRVYYL